MCIFILWLLINQCGYPQVADVPLPISFSPLFGSLGAQSARVNGKDARLVQEREIEREFARGLKD
jgi:hypothetical protein